MSLSAVAGALELIGVFTNMSRFVTESEDNLLVETTISDDGAVRIRGGGELYITIYTDGSITRHGNTIQFPHPSKGYVTVTMKTL